MLNLTERKKSVLLTVSSNLFLQFVTVICGFILPTLIIVHFGSAMNGMVSSIKQFISYLNIVEAGVGGAAIVALYKPLAEKNENEQSGIMSATARLYNKSGILFVLLIGILAIFYPLFVDSQIDRITSSSMVLILGITGAVEFFFIGKYRVLLTADKKVYLLSFVRAGATIINTIIAVVLIKIGMNLLVVNLLSSLVYLSRYFIIFWYVKRKYPLLNYRATPNKLAINQSNSVLIHQIGGLVVFNSPFIILTIFCSLTDVSIYSVYAMVFTGLNGILSSFSNGLQAFFGESFVKENIHQTNSMYSKFESIFYVVMTWIYSMTYILIIPFMKIYTQGMNDASYIQLNLAILLILSGLANQLRCPCNLIINAAGHYKQTQMHSLLEAIINVVASVFFTIKFGFVGVVVGSLCSYAYRTIDIIFYANKKLLKRNFMLSLLKVILIMSIFVAFLFFRPFLDYFTVTTMKQWFVYAGVWGVVLSIPACLSLYIILKIIKG